MSLKNPFVVEFGDVPAESPMEIQESPEIPTNEGNALAEVHYVATGMSTLDVESDTGSTPPVYSKLEVPLETFSGHNSRHTSKLESATVEQPLYETLCTLLLSIFYLGFSLGIAFWHESESHRGQAEVTLGIWILSAILVHLTFAFNRNLSKAKIWDTNKVFAILTVIPGTLSILLSFADVVFGIKEANDRGYVRPWTHTQVVYLVETLVLVLPQCVVQAVFLLENPESIPNLKGLFVMFGLGVLTVGMALTRIRFDSAQRPDRFGSGVDKIVRWAVIWGNKGLWVTTLTMLVVTVRLIHPNALWYTVGAVVVLTVTYEVPLLLSSLAPCKPYVAKISGVFFLIPQFVSLFVLILWVNTDTTVYLTNIGICAMGAFSWFESLTLIGWLLDGCNDREIDILPLYPHFFGDVYSSSCCKSDRH